MTDGELPGVFEQDAEAAIQVSDAGLKRISDLANQQMATEDEIQELNEQLGEKQKRLRQISEIDLPLAMEEVGLKEFSLIAGEKVSIYHGVKASIPKIKEMEAFAWLKYHRAGSLIKNQVIVTFSMKQDAFANKFIRDLRRRKIQPQGWENKKTVHPQSLTAFVRTQLEEGREIPLDLLGVFQYDQARITRPKNK
jgi:hypothetical protein